MSTGEACGKIILFNEHFVLYGIPAIACAINTGITAKIQRNPFLNLINKINPINNAPQIIKQQIESIKKIFQAMPIPLDSNLEITLEGNLIPASGIGSSAASCISITRAISNHYNLKLTQHQINSIGLEGEKIFHGNPSGIDNTVATYGKPIWFIKNKTLSIETINLKNPIRIVIGYSGITASTKDAVKKVKETIEKNLNFYTSTFSTANKIAYDAKTALGNFDLIRIGKLMNQNHTLLQELGVSCPQIDHLVEIAKNHGALGAKITGGGLGGCMIALTPQKKLQEHVSRAIENSGFKTIKTEIKQ